MEPIFPHLCLYSKYRINGCPVYGVYCSGELYTNSRDYKNSPAKPSKNHVKNLFSVVNHFQESIWDGVPVTVQNRSNIFMDLSDKSYNPAMAVLEKYSNSAVGLLYFTGALGNGVNQENRSRNVLVSVKEAGKYKAEVSVTNSPEPKVYEFAAAENTIFEVLVATTNTNVALIRITKTATIV